MRISPVNMSHARSISFGKLVISNDDKTKQTFLSLDKEESWSKDCIIKYDFPRTGYIPKSHEKLEVKEQIKHTLGVVERVFDEIDKRTGKDQVSLSANIIPGDVKYYKFVINGSRGVINELYFCLNPLYGKRFDKPSEEKNGSELFKTLGDLPPCYKSSDTIQNTFDPKVETFSQLFEKYSAEKRQKNNKLLC